MSENAGRLDNRVLRAAFRHYTFVSYPIEQGMECFVRHFHDDLRARLRLSLPDIRDDNHYIFKAPESIPPGQNWEQAIEDGLRGSLTMIALGVPTYCQSKHAWCGREWAGMQLLQGRRLPDGPGMIIPIKLTEGEYEEEFERIECIDLSGKDTALKKLHKTAPYDRGVAQAVRHITIVVNAVKLAMANGVHMECADFRLPKESAFTTAKPPSLRGE